MAFIFCDLVVIPVLRVNAEYYGWKMAFYILGVFLIVLVATAMILHYGFAAFGLLPSAEQVRAVTDREFFKLDYTFWLNIAFGVLSLGFLSWKIARSGWSFANGAGVIEKGLFLLALVFFAWLAIGIRLGA